jgi:four helix bundle protein
MNKEELKKRTKESADECVKFGLNYPNTRLGENLQGQLIRASTSAAANYRAACLAQSKKSFAAKLSVVIEESDESNYRLEFIKDENLINNEQNNILIQEAKELTAISIASRKTIQTN